MALSRLHCLLGDWGLTSHTRPIYLVVAVASSSQLDRPYFKLMDDPSLVGSKMINKPNGEKIIIHLVGVVNNNTHVQAALYVKAACASRESRPLLSKLSRERICCCYRVCVASCCYTYTYTCRRPVPMKPGRVTATPTLWVLLIWREETMALLS